MPRAARFRFEPGQPPVAVVALQGSLNAMALPGVAEAVAEALTTGTRRIVLDVGRVEFLDSTVIGYFVELATELREEAGDLALASPSPFVERTMETLGISQMLEIHPTVADAAAALR